MVKEALTTRTLLATSTGDCFEKRSLTIRPFARVAQGAANKMGVRRRSVRRNSSVSSEELLVSVTNESHEAKVRFAKRKKPDTRVTIAIQVTIILVVLLATAYVYYCFEHFHWHVTWFYAHHVNDHHAQHRMGHLMLKDRHNETAAFEYFRRSASQGHPESAYNLAAGHLSGYKTDVQKGEVKQLLKFAADRGVVEAKNLLEGLCKQKPKHCEH